MQPSASALAPHSRPAFYLFPIDQALTRRVRYWRGSEADDGSVDIRCARLVSRARWLHLHGRADPDGSPARAVCPRGGGSSGGADARAKAQAALAGGAALAYYASGGAADRGDAAGADDARANYGAARGADVPKRARLGDRVELRASRVRARSRVLHECSNQGVACPRLRSTRRRWERPKPATLPRAVRP